MNRLGRFLVLALSLVGAAAIAGVARFASIGVSARPDPSRTEMRSARAVRHLLIPRAARTRANPVEPSSEVLTEARAHFADHCASCHGNDGKGKTAHGARMFPRAPDLTAQATQSLSDGELFWIVENGVRMTGMPAFGSDDPADDAESWGLVRFVRTLPRIGAAELAEMERLNPTLSRADVERERENEEFLAGGAPDGE